jgi:hypothetical protein
MFRRCLHHDAPDRAVARVEDVIEALGQERSRLGHTALDHRHRFAVEILR